MTIGIDRAHFRMNPQTEIFMDSVRHVAKLCATAAMTAPKSGGQLFLKGGKPFIETVIVDEFTKNATEHRASRPDVEDWEFAGPICQMRCIDLGIAVGSAAKAASLHNIDTRCQTRIAAAARPSENHRSRCPFRIT